MVLSLALLLPTALLLPSAFPPAAPSCRAWRPHMSSPPPPEDDARTPPANALPPPPRSKQFDLRKLQAPKDAGGGAGFNQFDPVLTLSGFISRRFGLVGGLAVVALLAATEGSEIVKSLTDKGPQPGSGEVVTTPSGLKYVDILVGQQGDTPRPGTVVGFNAVVSIGDKVLFDTAQDKPVAFKVGQRPFQNILCEGVEEGLKGMRVGSKRKLFVPAALAPKGVDLPPGVALQYEIEVTEVLPGYF
ncbi:hypothetical protein AB1Y20_003347 [Prymnesium parvum]|uniref:peptidylprolyl isomerase n=1 Tax=Prymnesium parvum TaxID=97485 RepID=A0AB34JBN2_PRYPA